MFETDVVFSDPMVSHVHFARPFSFQGRWFCQKIYKSVLVLYDLSHI